jgi:hypothetical protein
LFERVRTTFANTNFLPALVDIGEWRTVRWPSGSEKSDAGHGRGGTRAIGSAGTDID